MSVGRSVGQSVSPIGNSIEERSHFRLGLEVWIGWASQNYDNRQSFFIEFAHWMQIIFTQIIGSIEQYRFLPGIYLFYMPVFTNTSPFELNQPEAEEGWTDFIPNIAHENGTLVEIKSLYAVDTKVFIQPRIPYTTHTTTNISQTYIFGYCVQLLSLSTYIPSRLGSKVTSPAFVPLISQLFRRSVD